MKKQIIFFGNKKSFAINLKECNFFWKGVGLMFSRREKAKNLLFRFNKKIKIVIHSFFVFFPFIAIWLDEKNKIIDIKIVKPFTSHVVPREKSLSLIELPLNEKNKFITQNIFFAFPSLIRKI